MESNIVLIIIILAALYIILESVVGDKKYLDRFVANTIPPIKIIGLSM